MGLGLHGGGIGAAKFFVRQGAKVLVTDLKTRQELTPSLKKLRGLPITYTLGRHRKEDFTNTDLVIQNPGVPRDSRYLKIARRHKIPIETDIGIFFELVPPQNIIGITGTRGKSTTAALTAAILREKFPKTVLAGNIRASVFENLSSIKPRIPVVLELSSWQLEGLTHHKKSPHVAVITNILRDHLNRYPSFRNYVEAKKHLVRWQKPGDTAVLNKDDRLVRPFARGLHSRVVWISNRAVPKRYRAAFRLAGEHNLKNLAAALAVAKIYRVPDKKIIQALKNFRGLEGRIELVTKKRGVTFYNDTTATSPDATIAALKSFPNVSQIILITGGTDKKLDFRPLARFLEKTPVKAMVLLPGTATKKLQKALGINDKSVKSMGEATRTAWSLAKTGDVVLLSPGAASFGLFQNEFDRGEKFVKAVRALSMDN